MGIRGQNGNVWEYSGNDVGISHQNELVRMARLHAEGKDRHAVQVELDIGNGTYYRWRNSAEYERIVTGILGEVRVPVDHPDFKAAQDIYAEHALTLAQIITVAARKAVQGLADRIGDIDNMSTRDLIAACKLLLDEESKRSGAGTVSDDEPLTEAEVAAMRRMVGAA